MIVVDTTVWIDYFAGRTDEPHVAELLRLIDADAGIALTDVIFGEILQGLRGEHTLRRVDKRLQAFDILRLRTLDDFRDASALYRHARSKGKTIRRTLPPCASARTAPSSTTTATSTTSPTSPTWPCTPRPTTALRDEHGGHADVNAVERQQSL